MIPVFFGRKPAPIVSSRPLFIQGLVILTLGPGTFNIIIVAVFWTIYRTTMGLLTIQAIRRAP